MHIVTVAKTLRAVLTAYDPFVRLYHGEDCFPVSLECGLLEG